MPDFDRLNSELVLIVDDIPENLAVLHDALDEAGYTVLVATSGETALQRACGSLPDMIVLDAMMPAMDGFEVARRLKADFLTRHIPIVFMTGLTETEHVLAAFDAGGADYVTKPIRPQEVLARIAAHLHSARLMKQARSALDAVGQATLAVRPASGRVVWQTPLARNLMKDYFAGHADEAPPAVMAWLHESGRAHREGRDFPPLHINRGARRLVLTLPARGGEAECLLSLREESDAAVIEALMTGWRLTHREAEVLYWVSKGKTSPDIGDILGTSPRTVNKHLEHVFTKLGVENRTAAAAMAMARVRSSGDG